MLRKATQYLLAVAARTKPTAELVLGGEQFNHGLPVVTQLRKVLDIVFHPRRFVSLQASLKVDVNQFRQALPSLGISPDQEVLN
jgi:hypothetical protein